MIVVPWVLLMVGVATVVIVCTYRKGTYTIAYIKAAIRGQIPVILKVKHIITSLLTFLDFDNAEYSRFSPAIKRSHCMVIFIYVHLMMFVMEQKRLTGTMRKLNLRHLSPWNITWHTLLHTLLLLLWCMKKARCTALQTDSIILMTMSMLSMFTVLCSRILASFVCLYAQIYSHASINHTHSRVSSMALTNH